MFFLFQLFQLYFFDLFICSTSFKICLYSIRAARAAFETTKKNAFYLLDSFRPKDFSDCRTQWYDSLWFTNHYRIMWVEGYLISYKYNILFCKGWVFWVEKTGNWLPLPELGSSCLSKRWDHQPPWNLPSKGSIGGKTPFLFKFWRGERSEFPPWRYREFHFFKCVTHDAVMTGDKVFPRCSPWEYLAACMVSDALCVGYLPTSKFACIRNLNLSMQRTYVPVLQASNHSMGCLLLFSAWGFQWYCWWKKLCTSWGW